MPHRISDGIYIGDSNKVLGNLAPYKCVACASRGDLITYPSAYENRRPMPLNYISQTGNKFSLTNDGGIRIGAGLKAILLSYTVRIDWDAPTNMTYYFGYGINGGFEWASHNACIKEYNIQYNVNFGPVLIWVNEGDVIHIYVWGSSYADANTNMYVTLDEIPCYGT